MYVYKLPNLQRRELCSLLDRDGIWEQLGVSMKFDSLTLQSIEMKKNSGNSPSDELLTLWGQYNHTVLELFFLLKDLKHTPSLTYLKPFVDRKYHRLIRFAVENEKINNNQCKNGNCQNIESKTIDEIKNMIPVRAPTIIKTKCENMMQDIATPNIVTQDENDVKGQNFEVFSQEPFTQKINYEELRVATFNWDKNYVLGKGGFGTVYKGIWKCTRVAVKRIETRNLNSEESFRVQMEQSMRELIFLNKYKHDNILSLYGYSTGGEHPCLVYQYLAGGNLDQRLHPKTRDKMINWQVRINIARGVARGLQFLHTVGEKPLIHGDIKPANILLDHSDEPKIGDFGLAREGPMSDFSHIKVSRLYGTKPYLPDEFLRSNKMSTKLDTFSFGVVLFEIATALSVYSEHREYKLLTDFINNFEGDINDLKDKRCAGDDNGIFHILISVGKECVNKRAKDRPEMVNVLIKLGDHLDISF